MSGQSPNSSLLTGALSGAVLGAIAGAGLFLWELLVLGLADVEAASPELRPLLAGGYAMVGAVGGLLAAAGGARGPHWATAAAWSALGWIASPMAAAVLASVGLPGAVGVVLSIALGTGLGVGLGAVRAPAWLHLGAATWLWCSLSLLAPLVHHLLPGLNFESFVAACAAVALALVLAAFTAAFAVRGRWPWVPVVSWTALGGLLLALLPLRPVPPVPEARLDAEPIVFVVLSGLRADHTGPDSVEPGGTPNLDAFGEGALVFEQAHATSNWSVPSLGSLLTGRLPHRHGAGRNDGERQRHSALAPGVDTLPADLGRAGSATAAFVGDPRLRLYGLDRGFAVWEDAPDRGAWPSLWPLMEATGLTPAPWPRIATASQVTDRAIAWLSRQPETGWVLLVEYADAGQPTLPDGYPAAVSEVDRELGRLLDALPADAWVVVVGDRGRSLGETRPDMLRTAGGVADGHHVYEELLHVPLAMRLPTAVPARIPRPVSIVDVVPTLLTALDQPPLPLGDGAPLEPVFGLPLAERVVIAQSTRWGPELQAVVALGHKLMVTRDGRTRLYDRGADPGEQRPIPVGLEHDDLLRQLLLAVPPPRDRGRREDLGPRLGQLGARLLGRR